MARRTKRKKRNPTGLETALIAGGTALVGGIIGFVVAAKACGRLIVAAQESGSLQPGPNYDAARTGLGAMRRRRV